MNWPPSPTSWRSPSTVSFTRLFPPGDLCERFFFVCFFFLACSLAGKAKAALKGAATSVLQQLLKHAFTSPDGGVQRWAEPERIRTSESDSSVNVCARLTPLRIVYDSSVKTLNEILDL